MGFPVQFDKAAPADADNPSAGAAEIRSVKSFLEDLFGILDTQYYSAKAMDIGLAGQITVAQQRLLFQNGSPTIPAFAFAGATGSGLAYDGATTALAVLRDGTRVGYLGIPQPQSLGGFGVDVSAVTGSAEAVTGAWSFPPNHVNVWSYLSAAQRADVIARTASVDVTAAVQAAAAALQALGGGVLRFPPGKYRIFSSTTGTLCAFEDLEGIACLGYGATLEVYTSKSITASEGYLFYFDNCKNVFVDGFITNGPTLDVSSATVKGYEFVRCVNGCRNICLPHNRIVNSLAGFICSKALGDADSMRTQNITIGLLDVVNCWYGINGQYSGDHMNVGLLRTDTVHRSFFVYGASHLRANILSKDHKAADVSISSAGGVAMEDVEIHYASGVDSTACGDIQKIELAFSDQTPGTIRDMRLRMNVRYHSSGSTGGAAFLLTKKDNGGNPDSADRGHRLENLILSGAITGVPSYNSGGAIVTDALATWGTDDEFSNIALKDVRIDSADDKARISMVLGNVNDHISLKNVYTPGDIVLTHSVSDTRLPYTARVLLENVSCANRYAVNGSVQPLDILRSTGSPFSIPTGWSGKVIGNLGTGGACEYDLPAAVPGLSYTFVRNEAAVFDLDPNGTEIIRGGTAGQALRMNEAGNLVVLACYVAGTWEIVQSQGSTSFV